jgi:hypothetical protein
MRIKNFDTLIFSPSVKRIQESFNISRKDAESIKALIKNNNMPANDDILDEINLILEYFGVEAIFGKYTGKPYYQNIQALYVNSGDSYAPEIYYDTVKDKFYLSDGESFINYLIRNKRIEKG